MGTLSFKVWAVAIALFQGALAFPVTDVVPPAAATTNGSRTCNATSVRKPWDWLTAQERSTYLQAELCLMTLPSKLDDVPAAVTRWDDLQHVHVAQTKWIHFVGAFLPWHRYYVAVHQRMLRDECNYTGPLPYWVESYAESIGISNSSVFQADAFGTNGFNSTFYPSTLGAVNGTSVNNNTVGGCVYNGAFSNVTLHIQEDTTARGNYCISRNFDQSQFSPSSQSTVDDCLNYTNFVDAWDCLEQHPHRSGHAAIGGLMTDVTLSPGDPIFYMHHTWLDSIYWQWQSKNLSYSLTAIGGTNRQDLSGGPGDSDVDAWEPGTASFTDYNGDPGNVTTLNHTLWMAGVSENLTIADLMDATAWPSCAEYLYPDKEGDVFKL